MTQSTTSEVEEAQLEKLRAEIRETNAHAEKAEAESRKINVETDLVKQRIEKNN